MERIDLFAESLPRNCLYCAYGYVVIDEPDFCLIGDHLACTAHAAEGVKSKKFADVPKPNRDFQRAFCPIMNWDETCDLFKPLKYGGRKFRILYDYGLFRKYWRGEGE